MSMISKRSTIPVPDSLQAPRQISFTFHFWHKSFIHDGVKLAVIQQQFWMTECDFREVQTYSTPPTYFQGFKPPESTPSSP